ncbi:MAG: NFACT family protein [Proteobacteria bacterium]|nr:NFACT family protein [Pseudomonadota bacterium]
MKQISSLELNYLVKEFKLVENSRVDRIYNDGKEDVYIQLHKSNEGKKILRIIVGKCIFFSATKSIDESPSGFCLFLRKHLEGKFLDSIEQLKPERILKLIFKSKDETKNLYLEFLGKGNVILCDKDDMIIDCLIRHKFKDRTILPKNKYIYPNMQYDLFDINNKNLITLLKNSKRDKIITSLATELGLGGVYSEEICLMSDIDKSIIPKKINNNQITKLINSLKKLVKQKSNANLIFKEKELIDAIPIDIELYKDCEKKNFSNYNEALNEYFAHEIIKKKESPYMKKISELKWIISEQEDTLKSLKVKGDQFREKADIIYSNYQIIKDILDEINKASKSYSWKEIKEKVKGHKVVKDVDVKEKRVVLEI